MKQDQLCGDYLRHQVSKFCASAAEDPGGFDARFEK
jgi:hypothetical protein